MPFSRPRTRLPFPVRLAAVLTLALLTPGCAAAIGAGSVITTEKTPIDHVWSLATGKDCSIVRKQRGLTYCVEDEIVPPVTVHCYPTLGEASCYAAPDPYPGKQRQIGGGEALAAAPGRPSTPSASDVH